MDALANYGSDDSNSSADENSSGKGISGLLGHYSDSDNDEAPASNDNDNKKVKVNKEGDDNNNTNSVDGGQPNKKKRRRWDNPRDSDATNPIDINSVLPTPKLSSTDTFQSLTTFNNDYTTNLRRKLSQQLQTQTRQRGDTAVSAEKQQLNTKLEQLYKKFQSESSSTGSSIKSNNDFGNPHLLKSVIDHYELKGLGSNIGNSFKSFEQIDRLVIAEEKARIAQANN
jgi:hypothetical protein